MSSATSSRTLRYELLVTNYSLRYLRYELYETINGMRRQPNNPFVLLGYAGMDYFCNRKAELSWMEDNFRNERNMVLYSRRRMGKTALIQCFTEELSRKKKAETLRVDLFSTHSTGQAIETIVRALHHKYGNLKTAGSNTLARLLGMVGASLSFDPVTGVPKLEFGLRPAIAADLSLEAIGQFLSDRKLPVIVAMDEFQQVVRYDEPGAEAVFRSWMQENPGIRFIFSGSQRNMMQSMFTEGNRPFYMSAQLMELQPISAEDYIPFIARHFEAAGKSISAAFAEDILAWSRSQTYYVQLVCNKLFSNCRKVTHDDLEHTFHDIIMQSAPMFMNYNNLLTTAQWNVLVAIAKAEPVINPTANDFLLRYRLGSASTVSSALQALVNKELVEESTDGYFVHDTLLMRWLAKL